MAIEGPLRELSIHDVFQLLDLSRKTGTLRVASELRQNSGTIYFDHGAVVYAEIHSNPHPLGDLLLRSGRITQEDLDHARDRQQRQGDTRRLGEILVSQGAITARELTRQIRFQIEEVVFEVTSWTEGHFSFAEGEVGAVPEEGRVRIPTEALLMEAARRIDEWGRIEKHVPHVGVVPALAPSPEGGEGELDLLPPEWEVLALIDGRRDVTGIARELGRSEFDVAKTLFGLESAEVIVLAPGGAPPAAAGAPVPGDEEHDAALRRIEAALGRRDLEPARAMAEQAAGARPQDAAVHLLLGRVHLAAGRAQAAVDALGRALRLDPRSAPALRVQGFAFAALGRFREAGESWDQWERLASQTPGEEAQLDEVRRARAAAQTLAGALTPSVSAPGGRH